MKKKDDTINVLYAPNKPDLPEKCSLNVTHLHPLTRGAHLSPPCPSRVRGWRRMAFQTTCGYHDQGINEGASIEKKHMSLL